MQNIGHVPRSGKKTPLVEYPPAIKCDRQTELPVLLKIWGRGRKQLTGGSMVVFRPASSSVLWESFSLLFAWHAIYLTLDITAFSKWMWGIAFTFKDFPSLYKRKTKRASNCGQFWCITWGGGRKETSFLRLNHVPRSGIKLSEGKSRPCYGQPTMKFSRGSSTASRSGWLPGALDSQHT